MQRKQFALAALGISLSLSGCAVLTIDVDVYKGALANHESVQTEQVAAMAMGAKPLLAELRFKLEDKACHKCPGANLAESKAEFIPPVMLQSRDAQRVNEILSLYEDSAVTGSGQILQALVQAAERLLARFKEGKPIVVPYVTGGGKTEKEKRAEALAKRTWEARYKPAQKSNLTVAEPEKSEIEAVKSVWEVAEETWQEAIRVLSSEEIRSRLKKLPGDRIWDVAWVAAELTSGEGLRRFLTDKPTPDAATAEPLAKLANLLPVLKVEGPEPDKTLTEAAEDAVEALLAQMLV